MLDQWFDVDTYADLTRLRQSIDAGLISAPQTEAVLRNLYTETSS